MTELSGHLQFARVRPWSLTAFVLVSILSTAVNAYIPVWSYDGCGYSPYSDAGTMPLSPSQQVIGGQETRPYEFPWQVWIQYRANGVLLCGGVILNRRWIVTDAWCAIGYSPNQITVVLGDYQRSQPSSYRQSLDVASIVIHPGFNQATFENDIALILTTVDITLYSYVFPICAPDSSDLYANRFSQSSGWGTTQVGASCCEDILRYTTLNITSNAWCRAAIPGLTIFDSMVCTTDNRGNVVRGSCIGDAGSPLSVKEFDGRFHLVGIVSWHINDCASGYPDGYTRISSYIDWITEYVIGGTSSADDFSTLPTEALTTEYAIEVTTSSETTVWPTPPAFTTAATSTPLPPSKLYPAPYVKTTMAAAINASDAITASCSDAIASDFRRSFQDIVTRINSAISSGQLCTTSGGAITVVPGQIQSNFVGIQGQLMFSLLVGTNPADTVTIGLDESCSWEAAQFLLVFENWRQPIISNLFGCPIVDISPPGFSWDSSQWGCF